MNVFDYIYYVKNWIAKPEYIFKMFEIFILIFVIHRNRNSIKHIVYQIEKKYYMLPVNTSIWMKDYSDKKIHWLVNDRHRSEKLVSSIKLERDLIGMKSLI